VAEHSSWPSFSEDEIAAVAEVLRSGCINYWNGDHGRSFEREFAAFCGVLYAVAVANGSVALELALEALGIGPGDEVIVTPRTFVASASSIVLRGARPVFADVDPDSQNVTADTVSAVLSRRTRAIMAVHLAGWPCEMDGLQALADAHGLKLIEDCAQAHGASYRGARVGSLGDASAFSFCTDKIMSTGGEGGMLTLRDDQAWRRAWSYKDHGKDWDAVYNREHPPGFRWVHESFGTNWRLTEMQSALGRIQLRKLDEWLARRSANAARLSTVCRTYSALRVPEPPAHVGHAYYKFYCFVRPERLRSHWSRDAVIEALQARGVACMQGACPEVYLEKAFDGTDLRPKQRFPVARELGETSLMFDVDHTLSDQDMDRVCASIERVMSEASC
jgi:dTDP-4-amino-4,6-dideoxygalactose transaminase